MKIQFSALLLALCVLVVSAPAFAEHKAGIKDSAVKYYAKSYESVDIAYYMDKVKEIFFNDEFKAKHPMAGMIESMFTAAGYFAIERYDVEYRVSRGVKTMNETMVINRDYPDSFISRYIAVPNYEWEFNSLLSEGDYVFLLAISGIKEKMPIFMDYVTEVGKVAEETSGGEADINFGPLGMLQMAPELMDAFGNEMDIVVFDAPDLSKPIEGCPVNAAIMIPVKDYEGVKNLLAMAGGFAGFDISKPAYSTLSWKYYPIPGTDSAAFGLSREWLVLASDYKAFSDVLRKSKAKAHKPVTMGSTYMRIDVDRIYNELGKPLIDMMGACNPNSLEPQFAELFNIKPGTEFGEIEFLERHKTDMAINKTTMNDDVFNLIAYALSLAIEKALNRELGLNVGGAKDHCKAVPCLPYEEEEAGLGGRDDEVPLKDFGGAGVYF